MVKIWKGSVLHMPNGNIKFINQLSCLVTASWRRNNMSATVTYRFCHQSIPKYNVEHTLILWAHMQVEYIKKKNINKKKKRKKNRWPKPKKCHRNGKRNAGWTNKQTNEKKSEYRGKNIHSIPSLTKAMTRYINLLSHAICVVIHNKSVSTYAYGCAWLSHTLIRDSFLFKHTTI